MFCFVKTKINYALRLLTLHSVRYLTPLQAEMGIVLMETQQPVVMDCPCGDMFEAGLEHYRYYPIHFWNDHIKLLQRELQLPPTEPWWVSWWYFLL